MGLALLVLVGGIIFLAIFFKMAERDRQKHHDELYKQDPEANLARLKAQIADSLESTRRGDVQNVMEGLSRERGKGADWDTAIKAALPKAAGFQILQIRNNIVELTHVGKSEQEAMEIVIREFVRPPNA